DESYAYLSLDATKALKLDAVSSASVAQNEKAYEVTLKSGNIFFNITKPLTDEETLNITTSTLTIGIRGTSGVVRSDDTVYVLDGSVEVTYNGETYTVNAGEIATLADGVVTVAPLKEAEVGEFAIEELRADEALENRVREASDLKVDVLLGIVPPSVFDELGYTTISVATDGTYDYTTSTYDVVGQTIGQITFTGYEVFESDATHEAKEGYEWRAVHLNMFFNEDNASYYGVVYSFPSVDYYTGEFVGDELLLIYNGIEYNECLTQKERVPHPPEEVDYEYFQYEWDKYAVRVPIGYDGYTLMFYNGKYYWDPDTQTTADHSAWEYITDGQEVASDPDTLFFRFD
ncbi:MAG: FecR domain-containing protein, partial [Oscillospiraceae bacterium]|nr:FecR domain-containing protein [Oscillospiraceae bacterium]